MVCNRQVPSCCKSSSRCFFALQLFARLVPPHSSALEHHHCSPASLFKVSSPPPAPCVLRKAARHAEFPALDGSDPSDGGLCLNLLPSPHLYSSCSSCLGSLLSSVFSAWTTPINCYDKYHFNLLINTKCVRPGAKGQDIFLLAI